MTTQTRIEKGGATNSRYYRYGRYSSTSSARLTSFTLNVQKNQFLRLNLNDTSTASSKKSVVTGAELLQIDYSQNSDREIARQRLLAAGFLVTSLSAPDNITILPPDELLEIGRLPEWARPTSELIDEDRGKY
jgi:hypothetical protein